MWERGTWHGTPEQLDDVVKDVEHLFGCRNNLRRRSIGLLIDHQLRKFFV
jgi:hypothetical protein